MPNETNRQFEFPKKIEAILAAASGYFARKGETLHQQIIVNSRYFIETGTDYDNWDGGMYGHDIYLRVPSALFYDIVDDIPTVSQRIRSCLNNLSTIPREYVANIYIELIDDHTITNWRQQSGAMLPSFVPPSNVSTKEADRLWNHRAFRLFISHKANFKRETAALKASMSAFGVSCFVAHEDIEPQKEWQIEIERALITADALVALLTKDFRDSNWTDQEIGAAVGRQIPVIPIRIGKDPYGFIGKYQAISISEFHSQSLAQSIYDTLWNIPALYDRLSSSLVARFAKAQNFNEANRLMPYLEKMSRASSALIDELTSALKTNRQVQDAFEVKDRLPALIQRLRTNGSV